MVLRLLAAAEVVALLPAGGAPAAPAHLAFVSAWAATPELPAEAFGSGDSTGA